MIDAGSFIGDFAAYAAARGAFCYAFEPVDATFEILEKTAELNGGKIFPVKKGLGNIDGEVEMFIDDEDPGGNTINVQCESRVEVKANGTKGCKLNVLC